MTPKGKVNFFLKKLELMLIIFKVKPSTILSPINGHSKKRTPLISGRIYFPRRNSGQTLIKSFLRSGQVISGPSV